jgi:1-pyrroline-5-carboxylate dehydrogenase
LLMNDALASLPPPKNEPVLTYAPGSTERAELKDALARLSAETIEIPLVIGEKEVRTGRLRDVRAPHRHALLLARCHEGEAEEVEQAVAAALAARAQWSFAPFAARAAVFLKTAELMATK